MKLQAFRIMAVFIIVCFLLFEGAGTVVQAEPGSSKSSEEQLEQQKKDTLDEIRSLKSDIHSVEQKIKELEEARSSLQTYIQKLDQQVNAIASQISELEKKIEEKKEEIAQKEEELQRAQAEADAQYERMKKRICYMYERGEDSFLVMLLESGSIAELLNRVDYARQMSDYDRRMLEELRELRDTIAECKAALEREQEEQEQLLEELEAQKAAVDRAISAKTQEIADYQAQITSASSEQGTYEEQLAEQEKLLRLPERRLRTVTAAPPGLSGHALPAAGSPAVSETGKRLCRGLLPVTEGLMWEHLQDLPLLRQHPGG